MLGLELIMTPDRGIGLRTSKDIKNGAFVMEYLGEVCLFLRLLNMLTVRL